MDQELDGNDLDGNEDVALLVLLLRFASVVSRPMRDGVAEPAGLSPNELRVMMCLGGEGSMAGFEMTEVMGMQPMNVSRALASLNARGWVEQVADPANRRRKPYRLSAAGWKAHAAMLPKVGDVADFLFAPLGPREKAALARTMEKVADRIGEWQAEG